MPATTTNRIPKGSLQQLLFDALRVGLKESLGPDAGNLLADVAAYHPRVDLNNEQLESLLETAGGTALKSILANKVDGPAMRQIRSCLIASALLADRESVVRWATQGSNSCSKAGKPWTDTKAEWQWAMDNPVDFIGAAREVKKFLRQI